MNGWPVDQSLVAHGNIRTLLAQSGVSDIPYAENREIDADEWAAEVPILIYDADSSQHSAIADILSGKNLTIFGPPGTGKSQTIANAIAAATMAGKKVLFVAEKLTALEVVQDRLEKAGLGPFCFNLHAQGLKASAVRRSLQERASMPRPVFDPSQYEQQRQAWTRQRDALRTYARVMGTKIGKFDESVHDVLWRTIDRKGSEASLPSAVSAAQLANVEEVAPAKLDETRNCIKRLVHAEAVVHGVRRDWQPITLARRLLRGSVSHRGSGNRSTCWSLGTRAGQSGKRAVRKWSTRRDHDDARGGFRSSGSRVGSAKVRCSGTMRSRVSQSKGHP